MSFFFSLVIVNGAQVGVEWIVWVVSALAGRRSGVIEVEGPPASGGVQASFIKVLGTEREREWGKGQH